MARIDDKQHDYANHYGAWNGSLVCLAPGKTWMGCRVTFHMHYFRQSHDRCFGYCFVQGQQEDVLLSFLTEGEERLALAEEDRVVFQRTARKNVYVVDPGPWWVDPVRFTLLTAMLRDATWVERGNRTFEDLIKLGHRYLSQTQRAILTFFAGCTFYQGKQFNGWCETFRGGDVSMLGRHPPEHALVECCHHPGWPYLRTPAASQALSAK